MQLSEAQKRAVEYLGGAQIILAGAGSGKTRVIVAKAQYLIEQKGFVPESLLVITYSRKTQAELEERMAILGASAPEVKTFHSFGMDIISEFGGRLGLPGDIEKASEYRLRQILKSAVAELKESSLLSSGRPENVYYDLGRFISRAKDEISSPEEIIARAGETLKSLPSQSEDDDAIVQKDGWTKILEAGRIYRSYERIKKDSGGLIDYGDMIYLSHQLLSTDKVVGAILRQKIKYIMVDEFQDTNFAQVQLLYHLAGGKCGITVVGDDDQAIYRFRGASFGSFRLFMKLFPEARPFRLEENFRSVGNIVRSAQSLIEADPSARFDPDKKMIPISKPGEKMTVRYCPDDISEAEAVAVEIEQLLKTDKYKGPRSIAVLFRARRHKNILEDVLRRRGIEFYYDQKTEEAISPPARLLTSFYGFVVDNRRRDFLLILARHFLHGLAPDVEREMGYRLSREDGDPLEILKSMKRNLDSKMAENLSGMIELLSGFVATKSEKDPIRLLERIISHSGLLSSVIVDGRIVDRPALVEISRILRAAESFGQESGSGSHSEFLEYLDWWYGAKDSENGSELEKTESPIVLSTVHGSKGLEYPAVFVIGLTNKKFPSSDRGASVDFPPELYKDELPAGDFRIQEERRLFYVALTRARERLYLYGVKKKGTKISRFVDELTSSKIFNDVGVAENVEESNLSLAKLIGPEKAFDIPKAVIMPITDIPDKAISDGLDTMWKAISSKVETPEQFQETKSEFRKNVDSAISRLYQKVDSDRFSAPETAVAYKVGSVSYSDLESFDTCPLQFYYKKILNMPAPPNPYMIFGSTIHSVLEAAARRLMDAKPITYDELAADYESRWGQIHLGDPDQKERMRQGGYELLKYFLEAQSGLKGKPLELEKKFAVTLGEIRLTGRIDRVDKTADGLEIIDYKTGRMNERKLKDDLQLPIYALACRELYGEYPVRLSYMFLKDREIHDESIDAQTIETAKSTIIEKAEKISKSDFTATPGYHCGNCPYNHICPAAER